MPGPNPIDRSLKALARRYPAAFVKLALGTLEDLTFETIENPEINLPEKRLDFVYSLRRRGTDYLLHLEFQLRHESDLPQRVFFYNAGLTQASSRPVISKVVYLERHDYRELPRAYVVDSSQGEGHPDNAFTYGVIKLWDYVEAITGGEIKELAPLLILAASQKSEENLRQSRELILTSPDHAWRADALSVAITVAGRYFTREFLLNFFKEEMKMLQEADIVQDWINEGMEKGMEKGAARALREAVLDILGDRFDILKPGLNKRLSAIDDPAVLRSLHKKSVKVESLEEFVRLLDQVGEKDGLAP